MLDVHPPEHPAHSWRDFFIHMGTICLGLLVALGLEQTAEYLHRQHEVREARRALDEEREVNRAYFAANVQVFRARVAMYRNDLLVLDYLQRHPGTPDGKLPGVLIFFGSEWEAPQKQAWEAAKQSGLVQYMPREVAAETAFMYEEFAESDVAANDLWLAANKASHYAYMDSRLSRLSPQQIADEIALTEICLEATYRWGAWMDTISRSYPDFKNGPTSEDLDGSTKPVVPPPAAEELTAPKELTKTRTGAAIKAAQDATAEADRKH